MAHPDSDGAAEMLEGGHRAVATGALRLAELYAQRADSRPAPRTAGPGRC
jgi:hypothetical protein